MKLSQPVVPGSFWGGSAPHVQETFLIRSPSPGLPNLLLSATRLVTLKFWRFFSFWIHLTRGDGHLSLLVGESRETHH